MKRHVALFVTCAVMAINACAAPAGPTRSAGPTPPQGDLAVANIPRATPSADLAPAAADAINQFGLALYSRVATGAGASVNLVFSPTSIALALAMTRPGAAGATATQIDTVLHGLAGGPAGIDEINALDQLLALRNRSFDTEFGPLDVALRIANAPFGQTGFAFKPAYLDALASGFGAGLRLVDYKADAEAARKTINAWVSDTTQRRIPELIGQGVLDQQTRLALVNAIYLKAPWAHRFAPADSTRPGPFTRPDGSTVDVPMMLGGGELPYAKGSGWQAVELPYVGDQLAMLVMVPNSVGSFEAGLDAARLGEIVKALGDKTVSLTFPRFSIETKTDVATTLAAMGMPDAFDAAKADFTGITTQEPIYISAVIHQANIDVDENGTEAAAATAVVMAAGSAAPQDPVTLTVDHPFLFAIRDRASGAILFMGRVADPSVGRR